LNRQLVLVTVSWLVAAILSAAYAQFVISNTVKANMGDYWKRGFPPITTVLDYLLWFPRKLTETLSFLLYHGRLKNLFPLFCSCYPFWRLFILYVENPGKLSSCFLL
jgi:hypothetical protein